jgi:phytoene dehydrogenase-like protein
MSTDVRAAGPGLLCGLEASSPTQAWRHRAVVSGEMTDRLDAVVVGAGPNGLLAAIVLAREGWHVRVVEAAGRPGGGTRSEELTLDGFTHDVCSAIHPLGIGSPAFRELGEHGGTSLEEVGVRWIQPDAPLAHTLRPGHSVLLERSLDRTAEGLGADGAGWRGLMAPGVDAGFALTDGLLEPLRLPPRHPFTMARFGLTGVRSALALGRTRFEGDDGPALLAGLAGHSMLPLDAPITGGFAMVLGLLGHTVGWPMAQGGSQAIADGLVRLLEQAGGEVRYDHRVATLDELPSARAVLCDVSPRQLISLSGDRMPHLYRRQLQRFRHGPGVFKLDWALDGPVPWSDPRTARAATVHVGGTLDEVAVAEATVGLDRVPDRPFMLVVQPTLFDPSRAPAGRHTLWAYCHVPNGCTVDMTERMEARIEAFAPGFRDRILARHAMSPAAMQSHDENYVGGDINGGAADLRQFAFRPSVSLRPWATPMPGVFLCSASTPPGGGVHGMCGRAAAHEVLRQAAIGRI